MRAPRSRADLRATAVVGAVAVASTLAAFGNLLPHFASRIGPGPGDPLFTLTILEWCAGRFAHGLGGVWNAPFFFPATNTLALSDHMFLPAAIYGAFRAFGAAPALAYNLLLVLSFASTAAATWALLRRATRAPRVAVAALALAVAFAPWRWGQLVHLLLLFAPGPPLALLAFDRLLARPSPRRACAFVAAEAVTLLSGCYLAYLTQLALVFVALVRIPRRGALVRWRRAWILLGVTGGTLVAIGLPVYSPYVAARHGAEGRRSGEEIRRYDVEAGAWLRASARSIYADRLPVSPRGGAGRELFPGILLAVGVVAAAGAAPASSWFRIRRRSAARPDPPTPLLGRALVLSGFFFVALANADLFVRLASVLPGLDAMRVPSRGQPFVLLGCAVLTAGLVRRLRGRLATRAARGALAAGVCALALLDLLSRPVPATEFFAPESRATAPPHVAWIAASDATAVAYVPLTGDWQDAARMWRQPILGKPVANGYSSFLPPEFRYLRSRCRTPRNRVLPACVDALLELGVSHAVVDDSGYAAPGSPIANRFEAAIGEEATSRVRLEFSDAGALVFRLLPAPPDP